MKYFIRLPLLLLLLLVGTQLAAQDVEGILKEKQKLTVTGGLGANLATYFISGDRPARASSLAYVLSGNLNFSYGELSVPINATYRDQQGSISNPFQYYGLSPRYKWITGHFGWRSLPLSRYSFSGQTYLGYGLEINPGILRAAGFRGKLRSPLVQRDTLILGAELLETFERKAWGGRLGIGKEQNHFDLIFLKVTDDPTTANPEGTPAEVFEPAENVVLGAKFQFQPLEFLNFRGQSTLSALTNDLERDTLDTDVDFVDAASNFITVNETTRAHFAHDYGFDLRWSAFRIGADYLRVDPFYKSLGVPYLLNDIERTTLRMGVSLFKRHFNVDGRIGRERNNLNELLNLTSRRLVGSVNLQVRTNGPFRLSARYYNYQNELQDGLLVLEDTLRRGQQTASYSLSPALNYRNEAGRSQLRLTTSYRQLSVQRPGGARLPIDLLVAKLSFSRQWTASNTKLSASLTTQQQDSPTGERGNYGFGLQGGKSWQERKWQASLGLRYFLRQADGTADGGVIRLNANLNHRITRKSQLGLRATWLDSSSELAGRDFSEIRINTHLRTNF
ncbi:MAG: hypothetical protein AAGA31_07700 [Bacteroidota bacterium]